MPVRYALLKLRPRHYTPGADSQSLQVLQLLLIFHADFVDQLSVDHDPLL